MVLTEDGSSIDYANPSAWSIFTSGVGKSPADRIPTVGDTAVINAGGEATLSSDVSGDTINILNVANQVPGEATTTGTLNVNSGGVLNTGRTIISQNGSPGFVNIQGGDLSSGIGQVLPILFGSNEGVFTLSAGSYTDQSVGPHSVATGAGGAALGIVNISGGTFNAVGSIETDGLRLVVSEVNISGGTFNMTGGQVIPGIGTVFTVEGNAATILTDRLNVNTNPASFVFKFDADGISPFESAAFMNLATATITVDGTHYTGGSASFPLFSATNIATLPLAQNISLIGWEGYDSAEIVTEDVEGTVVRISLVVTGTGSSDTWAGYAKRPDGYVDTGSLLGWIYVSDDHDFVWVVDLAKYIYLPEELVGASGTWTYLPN
jgi:hypothetical protein